MELIVKLVTTPASRLTVTPDDDGVSPSSNGITLTWTRDATGAEFQFTSDSLGGLNPPTFSLPSYDPSNNTISIIDYHIGASRTGTFAYTLSVKSGMTTYHASGNPEIINR